LPLLWIGTTTSSGVVVALCKKRTDLYEQARLISGKGVIFRGS